MKRIRTKKEGKRVRTNPTKGRSAEITPKNTAAVKDETTYISKAGGFLPFPPEKCQAKKVTIDGVVSTDLVMCVQLCGSAGTNPERGFCQRGQDYLKLLHNTLKIGGGRRKG